MAGTTIAACLDSHDAPGIGSYFAGSRLEIRPLTVLCGKNGSGKSTWLKVLNVLSDSLRRQAAWLRITDWESNNIQLTNAFYHLAYPDDHAPPIPRPR